MPHSLSLSLSHTLSLTISLLLLSLSNTHLRHPVQQADEAARPEHRGGLVDGDDEGCVVDEGTEGENGDRAHDHDGHGGDGERLCMFGR